MALVDFFYGVASRYSYLASTRLPDIERTTGCHFHWRPLFSGDLLALRGQSPFGRPPVSGQYEWSYRQRDAEEWAAHYGVPFREPPPALKGAALPRRLAVSCVAAARLGAVEAFSARLFRAVFADPEPCFDDTGLRTHAADAGLDPDQFVRLLDDPATSAELHATTAEAYRRGAFGVPTFFVGERMYWGNDRLVLLEHYLKTPAAPVTLRNKSDGGARGGSSSPTS